ncbi:hypothetical protein [Endozoicomonas sp. Mp262]|uniref:hypothetical protein n=1 Tax=Endozoicomonas sp. Mp262 TaxID=2919499 RepID=UPI0021DB7D8D
MSKIFWTLLAVVAFTLLTAKELNVRIQPGNSYLTYSFPRWAEHPWFEYDSRNN